MVGDKEIESGIVENHPRVKSSSIEVSGTTPICTSWGAGPFCSANECRIGCGLLHNCDAEYIYHSLSASTCSSSRLTSCHCTNCSVIANSLTPFMGRDLQHPDWEFHCLFDSHVVISTILTSMLYLRWWLVPTIPGRQLRATNVSLVAGLRGGERALE